VPPEIKLAHPDKLAAQSNVIDNRFNTWQDSLSTNKFVQFSIFSVPLDSSINLK